ncbi:MAG: 30S ribosomal protein S1 [Candidatus Poribacteria bacterium]|nr:30S ribosomal protein S1 [Candidatus Poribacteria bacterium]
MNNEQANTNVSTVDVEEEKHSAEGSVDVNQEVVSEAETPEDAQAASATDAEGEGQEEVTSSEEEATADDTDPDQADETNPEEAVEATVSDADSEETATLTDDTALEEAAEVAAPEVDVDAEVATTLTDETPPPEEAVEVAVPEEAATLTDETPSPEEEETVAAAEEPPEPMSPESLEEAYDNSIKAFTDGEIVKGVVVDVNRDEVMIDIGFKSEGYIPAAEFEPGQEGLPAVQVGDEIDVYIVRREDSEGQIVLSKKIADQTLIWDEIATAHESGAPVQGRITERIKGGLRVSVGSLRGFLPASQVELRPIQNLEQYVGQTLDMKVISLSKRRHNIVLSRRAWLEAELVQKRAEVLNTLEVGQLITGVVKNITAFGAFVDLGGVDGLLHKTDMAWKRIHHPSDVVSVGEEVEVQVIGISQENEKISLGLKQKTPDPWANIEEKYPVGATVRGVVVNIVNYGAFLQLEEGVEGLIHVSEMAWTRRNVAPSRIVNKGDEIEAIVLEISREDKRISLGLKQLQQNPWELLEQRSPVGSKITGRIRNLTSFGAFVEIEPGIDGLIHTSDLSWTKRGAAANEALKEGSEIEVVVLQIDAAERRVSLGLKQTQPDPWEEVPEKYKVGSVVRGKVVNLTSFGAFTKLEEGIEGLIHISELADRRIEKPEEIVSVGDELDLKVINLSPKDRRIGLSLKALLAEQERATTPDEEEKPARTRPERPSRSRREREPRRQLPAREETVTTLGALLKEEMGKSNAESVESSESVENVETAEGAETVESVEIVEDAENVESPESVEVVEDVEASESIEDVEIAESTEASESVEDAENPESTEDSEDTENSEN